MIEPVPFESFASIARLSRQCLVTEKPKRILTIAQKQAAAERWRRWAANNRERVNAKAREHRKRRYLENGRWRESGPTATAIAAWISILKAEPCSDCGDRFEACCMDFDHRAGTVKSENVGSMVAHHYSRESIESEIAKCDLVCANCHRIRTRDRRRGSGTGGRGR